MVDQLTNYITNNRFYHKYNQSNDSKVNQSKVQLELENNNDLYNSLN